MMLPILLPILEVQVRAVEGKNDKISVTASPNLNHRFIRASSFVCNDEDITGCEIVLANFSVDIRGNPVRRRRI